MNIEFLCAISTNSSHYAEYLKLTAESLSTSKSVIKWKCALGLDRDDKYEEPKGFTNLGIAKNKESDHGSLNHASTMHELIKGSDKKSDITIIVDADIAMLKKGWDVDVIRYLEKYDSFGLGWGAWDNKYMNFPSIMFIAFRTELISELDFDLFPVPRKKEEGISRYRASIHDSDVCNVPAGTIIKKDTGWKLPYSFREKNKTGFCVPKIKVDSKEAQLPFKNEKQKKYCFLKPTHMSEYILDNDLYATHLQASRVKPFDGENSLVWRCRINKYIKDKYGIKLC